MARDTYTGSNTSGVINLATKASSKVVERFKIGSVTEGLFSHDYDWTGVATVQVRSIDNLPLNDYNSQLATGESRFGALTEVGDTVQEMTVQDDKSFNGIIDKRNNSETLQTKAASRILKRQTDEVLIPYVDKYRLNAMAAEAGIAYFMSEADATHTLSKSTVVEAIMRANAMMSNQKVPDTGRVLYMGNSLAVDLKLADQVVGIDKLGEKSIVNGAFGKIDKCQVRLVPDEYMPAGVNFMIVKTGVALAPKKIETFRVLNNTHIVDGSLVQGRLLHDCFVLNTKKAGILVCMKQPYAVGTGLENNAATIASGKTLQLEPTVTLVSGGTPIKLANFTYSTSAAGKATVSATGLVTNVATGSANITISAGAATATAAITTS